MTSTGESYESTLRALYALAKRGIVPGLERVRAALSRRAMALSVVHVAGTNGKGSVCRMIAEGIGDARVGLYTSPHLHRLTERVRIDGMEIDRAAIVRAWAALGPDPNLTFFEAMTVMALELFVERDVDFAVLETGLGGRLDATNVYPMPRACAITRIALDHERFLGKDVASVAREKAGILKPGVPAVVGRQVPEAMAVIAEHAARIGAPLIPVELGPQPALPGAHQRENAAVALGVLDALEAQGATVHRDKALRNVRWPARLEVVERGSARFLLDGAHNPDGCEALARHLGARRSRALLFGAMADKDWRAMLDSLRPLVEHLVFSAASLPRAESPARLAGYAPGDVAADVDDAIALAARRSPEVVVAGSLYLTAEVRARLLGEPCDPPIAM